MKVLSNYTYSQIDKGMRKIIKILNEKGYETIVCCEGHLNDMQNRWDAHIGFRQNYEFSIPIPTNDYEIITDLKVLKFRRKVGACYHNKQSKTHGFNMYWWFSPNSKRVSNEQKETERKQLLERLRKWADELPYI